MLAAAGLRRLGHEGTDLRADSDRRHVPAPGQGIIAIEIADDAPSEVRDAVSRLSDPDAWDVLVAERAVVQALGGGCQLPLGVLARVDGQAIDVTGVVTSLDGGRVVRASVRGNRGRAAATGEKLAGELIAGGAAEILEAVSRGTGMSDSPSSHTK